MAPPTDRRRTTRRRRADRLLRVALPLAVIVAAVVLWDRIVVHYAIPHYTLPRPGLVLETLVADWPILWPALLNTLTITLLGLLVAVLGGGLLAILFSASKLIERALTPIAIIFQVTPIVAVFPLINIYVDDQTTKLLICTFVIAFFPILSNTTLGLKATDRHLVDLFALYGATRWQTLLVLRLPATLPYFLGGLRIAGGLALIGAVVAEFVAGTSGFGAGLASRIFESGYRLNMPRLFAALVLVFATGITIYLTLAALSRLALQHWHESERERDD
ncbi:MAG: ABC transporter permease subunit [Microbacterium sp.]